MTTTATMARSLQTGSRAKLLQLSWLLIALISINEINTSSASKSRDNNNLENDRFKRHIEKCDKQFKTFSNATVRIQRRHSKRVAGAKASGNVDNSLTVEVNAFGKVFHLDLTQNPYLFSRNYTERSVTASGKVSYFDNANSIDASCYYIGTILGQTDSAAAAVTCDGFRAQIATSGDLYHVEPVDGTSDGPHRVYRQSDSLQGSFSCGDDSSGGHDLAGVTEYLKKMEQHRKKRATLNWPNDLSGVTRVVELYVANDYSQYVSQGSNVTKTFARTKEIINFVSSLYQPLQVYVSLVGVEIWTNGNLITISPNDSQATLGNFTQYRVNNINPYYKNDNAQLLSNILYPNGLVGLAWTKTMCSAVKSSAIVSDIIAVSGFTAAVSAHEMGHNFGMLHDNQLAPVNCSCDDPTGVCIMQSFTRTPAASRWSNCSTSAMSSFLSSSSSSCLNDFNGVLFDPTPLCGNGIVESGEQCDCGNAPLTDCNANCCNKTTCKLIGSAVCATGRCCYISTCQLKPVTTVCRAANSTCDLAEYCSGVDSTCPSDVYKHDGANCTVNGEQAYCYTGSCQTRSTQCKLWWGPSTVESASVCYSRFNVQGVVYGNCGTINQTAGIYAACSTGDVLCGSLKCDVNNSFAPTIQILSGYSYSWYYASLSGNNCKMPVAPVNYVIPNLDMTPNGAACGANAMCSNRRCVNVASVLNHTICSCSQRGVCNNLDQCHCDIGYGPPDCSQPGDGGSYHSNQITQSMTSAAPVVTTTRAATTARPTTVKATTTPVAVTTRAATTAQPTTVKATTTPVAVTTRAATTAQPTTVKATTTPVAVTTRAATTAQPTTVKATTTPVAVTTRAATTAQPTTVKATTTPVAVTTRAATTAQPTTARATTTPVAVTTRAATTARPTTARATTTPVAVTTRAATTAQPTTVKATTTPVAVTTRAATTARPTTVKATTTPVAVTTRAATTARPTTVKATTTPVAVTTRAATTAQPTTVKATTTPVAVTTRAATTARPTTARATTARITAPPVG